MEHTSYKLILLIQSYSYSYSINWRLTSRNCRTHSLRDTFSGGNSVYPLCIAIYNCSTHYSRTELCSSTDLPMSRNSPTSPWRLMAMRMLRTVIPSQKHATTLAFGRWALSLSSSRSKLCSPALLQILPGDSMSDKRKHGLWRLWYVWISVASCVMKSLLLFTVFHDFIHSFNHLTSTVCSLHKVIKQQAVKFIIVKYMSSCLVDVRKMRQQLHLF